MYFLYHEKSQDTGEVIAEALGMPHGRGGLQTISFLPASTILIRWGSRNVQSHDERFARVLNKSEAIRRASDKLASLELMQDAGINVPGWSTDPYEALDSFGWPLMGRKKTHARGTDIRLCLQERDLRVDRDYWTQYIPTNREFRVHVVGDRVIRVQGKYLDDSSKYMSHLRNYATGYRFRAPRQQLRPERLNMAISSVQAHGLDFGAVDIAIGDDGQTWVFEVNTAPACSPLTGEKYVNALHSLARLDTTVNLGVLDELGEEGGIEDEI